MTNTIYKWIALGFWLAMIVMTYDVHYAHKREKAAVVEYVRLVKVSNADRAEMICMTYDLFLQKGGDEVPKMSAYCEEQRSIVKDYINTEG